MSLRTAASLVIAGTAYAVLHKLAHLLFPLRRGDYRDLAGCSGLST
jgi:hypothetical protein